jgi:hypothetical protein
VSCTLKHAHCEELGPKLFRKLKSIPGHCDESFSYQQLDKGHRVSTIDLATVKSSRTNFRSNHLYWLFPAILKSIVIIQSNALKANEGVPCV